MLGGVGIAMAGTRVVQLVQSRVFHTIPFGALSNFNIVDACVGITVATTLAEEQRQDLRSPQIGRIAQRLIETGSKKGWLDGPTLRQVLTFLKQALTAVNRQLRMTSKQAGRRRRRR